MRYIYTTLIVLLTLSIGMAQPSNDECNTALFLGPIVEFCSGPSEYTNVDATPSPQPVPPLCGPNMAHDVWFAFSPTAPAALIQILGLTDVNATPVNISNPQIVVYEGDCNNLNDIGCQEITFGTNVINLTLTDLTIGATYYIRVDAADEANFQLCISSFVPVKPPEADCADGVILCDKSAFTVEQILGAGSNSNEIAASCLDGESASVWYKWTCETAGTLTFTLTPTNPVSNEEDLDFVVYQLPGGLDDCANKMELRCMASGETGGQTAAQNAPCLGPTGLSLNEVDVFENRGCDPGDNNFVSAINMVAGASYVLVVNNFSASGFGFDIEFGGSGTFLGPSVDFDAVAVQEFECDKTIIFTDQSQSLTDPITSWSWNFGIGAVPPTANAQGPHNVIYDSFGPKTVSLSIESERGCLITEILDIFVEPCCADTTTIGLSEMHTDLVCNGIPTGTIQAIPTGGAGGFQYSIDGTNFQPISFFQNLGPGMYEVFVQDKKGCMASTVLTITEPPPLTADAGPDMTVDLGFLATINASYTPANLGDSISWCVDGVNITEEYEQGFQDSCYNCLTFDVLPFGTSTYTLKVQNEAGCIATDDVVITTNIIRPVFAPNIFSPNNDFDNEIFTLGFGPQVAYFAELLIYDRWGNMVYKGLGLPIHRGRGEIAVPAGADPQAFGWDGKINGTKVNPGVFTWMAKVLFIDQRENATPFIFTGDVTVVK